MPEPELSLDEEIKRDREELEAEESGEDSKDKPKDEEDAEVPKDEEPAEEEESEPEAEDEGKKAAKPEEPKKPAVIPAWRVAMERKRAAKAAESQQPAEQKKSKEETPADPIDELAKEYGFDDAQKGVIAKILDLAAQKTALPPELQQMLKDYPELKKFKETAEAREAEREFQDEIGRVVRPLVEREYPGASPALLAKVTAQIRNRLETDPGLIYTPLDILYRGDDSFRGLVPKKKTVDGGQSGSSRKADVVDFEDVSEEDIEAFDDETMDKYAAYMMQKERERK